MNMEVSTADYLTVSDFLSIAASSRQTSTCLDLNLYRLLAANIQCNSPMFKDNCLRFE